MKKFTVINGGFKYKKVCFFKTINKKGLDTVKVKRRGSLRERQETR